MSKELTTNTQGASLEDIQKMLMEQDLGISGLEGLNASDIKMPKFKLLQPTSREVTLSGGKLQAGTYYNTVTGETKPQLEAIFLSVGKTRVRWAKPFKHGQPALCRSFDAEVGEPLEGGSLRCATCKYGMWKNNEKDNRPECGLSYAIIGQTDYDGEAPMPFRIIFAGTSVSRAKDFFTKVLSTKKLPLFAYRVILSSKLESNEQGAYFVSEFAFKTFKDKNGVDQPLGPSLEQIGQLADAAKSLRAIYETEIVRSDVEDASEMGVAGSDAPASSGPNSSLF